MMDDMMAESGGMGSEQPLPAAQPPVDTEKKISEVNLKFSSWRSLKRTIEIGWFIQIAFVRGVQNIRWNDATAVLETKKEPSYKQRPVINKILPKKRAKKAKYLKTRYTPMIVPATSDKEDKLNAVASEKAIQYAIRKRHLETIYRDVLELVLACGKAFIWVYWDDTLKALVTDPITNQPMNMALGDVNYDLGSPFEMFVPDLGCTHIGDQQEIMRARGIPLNQVKKMFPNVPGIDELKGDSDGADLFQYQKQIATLNAKGNSGGLLGGNGESRDREMNFVIVKEWFARPTADHPRGEYAVVAADKLLKYQDFLPYGFEDMDNPYPVVEFSDIELAGQFWPTCLVEQLIGPQKEYNDYRSKLANHLDNQVHPKVIVSVFAKWPEDAWNKEAGEVIRVMTPPGMMTPQIVHPPQISQDIWNALKLLQEEFDEVSGIPPGSMGNQGGTTSGFQVNLLNEATDSIHAPDIRGHEIAHEEIYLKTRRLMTQGYTVPRLINAIGRSLVPDAVEFSQNNIDENAEIIVYTGSSLANSPAVRTQQVLELWNSGILQDDQNPTEGKRKALTMLDANGMGEFQEEKRRDEEKARLENLNVGKGVDIKPPLPFDDHLIHYTQHADQMKSPEFDLWDESKQKELFAHQLLHMKYINPQQAIQTAYELGMIDIVPLLMPAMPPAPMAPPTEPPPQEQNQPPSGGVQ